MHDKLAYLKYKAVNLTLVEVCYIHREVSKQKHFVVNVQIRLSVLLLCQYILKRWGNCG